MNYKLFFWLAVAALVIVTALHFMSKKTCGCEESSK